MYIMVAKVGLCYIKSKKVQTNYSFKYIDKNKLC